MSRVPLRMHQQPERLTLRQRIRFAAVLSGILLIALAATCGSCAGATYLRPATRTAAEQHNAAVDIEVACGTLDENLAVVSVSEHVGSGVVVGKHEILTAEHVAHCSENEVMAMFVDPGDGELHAATVDIILPYSDIARIHVEDDLSHWLTPISIGPMPKVGDRVCEAASNPRETYRCLTAQMPRPGTKDGDIQLDGYLEFGNSGAPLSNDRGQLVGIVVMLSTCQAGAQCVGYASSLAGREWLIP